MSTFDCGKIEKHSACCVENVPLKKLNRSYFGNLPHFLHFPYSPPFLMLCVSILLVVLNNFFHFMFFQRNRNSKDRITLGFWEPAHLPLP